jgi:hypothetical protein
MGGKALNKYGVFTERKNTEEFLRIGQELKNKIFWDLDGVRLPVFANVVTCYRNKADHGDLDLLICMGEGIQINWVQYIKNAFKPQAINSNGGVYSFDYQGFQVDIQPIPARKWSTAIVYFSYDPLGNIMGKTYHKFGLSYGWEGLFYKYRNAHGTNSANILLTNDVKKIFDFGGYDYGRYLKGFDTLEEIFNFAIDGKYFDTEMFQMENLKSIDKKRNRKRGSYHLFLNYLNDNGINVSYPFNKVKADYVPIIDNFFPEANLLNELNELQEKDRIQSMIAQKFNGDIVISWLPNLMGKELGKVMGKFKNSLGDDYDDFILQSTYAQIQNEFMRVYNDKSEQE